jgi:hypothetical protein
MTFTVLKKHRVDLLIWLHKNVEPADSGSRKGNEAEPIPPYHVSTSSQRAEWKGRTAQWRIVQSGMSKEITVDVNDARIELMLKLKYA